VNPLAALASLQTPDEAQMTQRAQAALRMVESMVIDSPETYSLAADELKAIKTKANSIEEQRTSITGPINQALRAINDLFRGPASFLKSAEDTIKAKMLGYQQEQERIAAEARRKAEEAAAAERARLEAEARAREQAAAAERERLAREEAARAAAAKAEHDRLAAEAAAAKAAGDAAAAAEAEAAAARQREADAAAAAAATRQAETVAQNAALEVAAIQQTAQVIVAPVVTAVPVRATGISTAKSFDFEVENLADLVKHIAAHPELVSLVRADEVKLRAYVRGLGANTKLPGVRVFEKKSLRAAA
jgi:hypothetical protein